MSMTFKQDGKTKTTYLHDEQSLTLAELQDAVACRECRLIEVVYLEDGSQMIINEEGLIHNLELNMRASLLAKTKIHGNVLILSGTSKLQ